MNFHFLAPTSRGLVHKQFLFKSYFPPPSSKLPRFQLSTLVIGSKWFEGIPAAMVKLLVREIPINRVVGVALLELAFDNFVVWGFIFVVDLFLFLLLKTNIPVFCVQLFRSPSIKSTYPTWQSLKGDDCIGYFHFKNSKGAHSQVFEKRNPKCHLP